MVSLLSVKQEFKSGISVSKMAVKTIRSFHEIFLNVLGMKRVAAKFVSKLLNFEQKQRQMDVAQESLNKGNHDADLLKPIITGDETWVYGYDVENNLIQIL